MFRVLRLSIAFGLISVPCFAQTTGQPAAPQATPRETGPAQQEAPPVKAVEGTASAASGNAVASVTLPDPLGEARSLYRKGDFQGAIAKYQQFLQLRPHSPDAYAGLVRVYLKQKNIEQAAQTAETGLAQSDAPRIHVARGEVWFRQGKIVEAEKEWVAVVNSGYPEARAYLGLARVRNAVAMYKSAKEMIDRAHALDPNDPDVQEEWIGTLARAQRIKYLQDSLAGENNWSADEREGAASYLDYLKARSKQKNGSCQLVSKVSATETPLVRRMVDATHHRGYGLAVVLNGHKSSLMLDTGASGILIRRGIAEHAGISKIIATKVWGIGNKGGRNAYVGVADSIKIGELEFQNCRVEVMESRSVAGEDGLIGADVFADFLVEIDFPNEKLKLGQLPKRPGESEQKPALKNQEDDTEDSGAAEPGNAASDRTKDASTNDTSNNDAANKDAARNAPAPPLPSGPQDRYIAPEMQSYTRVYRFGHDLLVPTIIGKVPYKLFLMDTGSFENIISPAAAREVTKVHSDSDTIVKGISGSVDKVYSANKAVLQFGHLQQKNQDIIAFDTKPISDGVGTEISGFLGFTALGFLDIKIDFRDALVDFQYDPKHWNQ